jgi:hypothetical protein
MWRQRTQNRSCGPRWLLIAVFFLLDLNQYLTLEHLKASQATFNQWFEQNPLLTLNFPSGAIGRIQLSILAKRRKIGVPDGLTWTALQALNYAARRCASHAKLFYGGKPSWHLRIYSS